MDIAMNRYDTKEWAELVEIQNAYYVGIADILSITGFMNDEQFLKHLEDYKQRVALKAQK
jgi:hypothetical protein